MVQNMQGQTSHILAFASSGCAPFMSAVSLAFLPTAASNSKKTDMRSPVVIDPEIMSGAPVFRGTRVPVRILFDHLETGETVEEFLEGYPSVSREQVIEFFGACVSSSPRVC